MIFFNSTFFSLPNLYKFAKLYGNDSLHIEVSLNIIGDASIMHFLFSQNILFFNKNSREIYSVMNKYHGQLFCQFGLQNSQSALSLRWQVAVKRGGRSRVI